MKKNMFSILGLLVTILGGLSSAHASDTIECKAMASKGTNEETSFQIQNGHANFSMSDTEIGGRTYRLEIVLSQNILKLSAIRGGITLHTSQAWTDASSIKKVQFSFMDGKREIVILCGS